MASIPLPTAGVQEGTLEQKYAVLQVELAQARAELRFVRDLLAIPASVMSASQKVTLLVIWMYVRLQVEQWIEIKSWELCEKAGQHKSTFLSNLSYFKNKMGILRKNRVRHEHKDSTGQTTYTTSLYIQPEPMLYSPSQYRVEEARQHGGPGRQKRTCSVCGTADHFDEYRSFQCRICGQWHHEEIDVENKPLAYSRQSDTQPNNQQDAHFQEAATEKNTGGGVHVVEDALPREDTEVFSQPVADDLSESSITNSKLLTERTQKNNQQVAHLEQCEEEEQNENTGRRGYVVMERTARNEKQMAHGGMGAEEHNTHRDGGVRHVNNEDIPHHHATTHTHRVLSPLSSQDNEHLAVCEEEEEPNKNTGGVLPLAHTEVDADTHPTCVLSAANHNEPLAVCGEEEATRLREQFQGGLLSELVPHPNWVLWQREGEGSKVPYHPSGRYRASSTNPRTWGTLEQALATLSTGRFAGLGFMLEPGRLPLTFIDLDHCLSLEHPLESSLDIRDPRIFDIVHELRSYTEVSPSGKGLHILAYGHLPGASMKTPQIEFYDSKRYFTVTGKHLAATPNTIEWREARLFTLYQAHKPDLHGLSASMSIEPWEDVPEEEPEAGDNNEEPLPSLTKMPPELPRSAQIATPPPRLCSSYLEVVQLHQQAERDPLLQALLRGETSMYGGDESVADYVLIMKLLHWSGDNVELTRRLFLDSPLGLREKDGVRKATSRRGESTYVDMTIQKVLRTRKNLPPSRPYEP